MIIVPHASTWRLICAYRPSILPLIFPYLVASTLWGMFAALIAGSLRISSVDDGTSVAWLPSLAPFSVLGVAISLFLSFRTNACYNRWWEVPLFYPSAQMLATSFTCCCLTK
jgi:putative membrane protein